MVTAAYISHSESDSSESPELSQVTEATAAANFRTHALYKVTPENGKYRCTWEGCTEKPMNRKCDYDEHVDTHVRPFTCSQEECKLHAFSRHYVLIRHKRSVHGIDSRVSKVKSGVHRCSVVGCGRAYSRLWDLHRHSRLKHKFVNK